MAESRDFAAMDHCLGCGHVRDLGNLGLCGECFQKHENEIAAHMVRTGDKVITPDHRYGTVFDTFGPACTVEFANGDRDMFSRSECKEAEHTHPGVLCSPGWCGGGQSERIFAQSKFWDGVENAERREILHQIATSKMFTRKADAQAWLTERYNRLVKIYPTLNSIPLATYVRRNTPAAMRLTSDADVVFEATGELGEVKA